MASTEQDQLEYKLHKMCRTCLVEEKNMLSIFDRSNIHDLKYNLIITTITGVEVSETDGLPSVICRMCKDTACHAYQFKQQSLKADVALRNLLAKKNAHKLEKKEEHSLKEIKYEKYEFNNGFDDDFTFDIAGDDEYVIEIPKKEQEPEVDNVCTLCTNTFPSESQLRSHLLSCVKVECDEEKASYCPICNESFEDGPALMKHVVASHDAEAPRRKRGRPRKDKMIIPKTKKASTTKLKENVAIKIVNKINLKVDPEEILVEGKIKPRCGLCHSEFETQDGLNSHIETHAGMEVMSCNLCQRVFLEGGFFRRHFVAHHTDVDFKNARDLQLMYDKVVNEERTDAICNLRKYIKLSTIGQMIKEANKAGKKAFVQPCLLCGRIFFTLLEQLQHNDTEHPDLDQRCDVCLKLFATAKAAAKHRRACEQSACRHECGTCGMRFTYEMSLNKHILRSHVGQSVSVNFINPKYKDKEKNFFCETCGKGFYRQELLEKHCKLHLRDGQLYECDICNKKFNRKDNLRSHTRIHDPNRTKEPSNCLCLYCGRSFSNSSNLIVHMRRHTGEKPYKCDFCGKGFPRSSDLQCHRRSHTGEKPCKCGVCGKAFSRSNKLSRHMRVHTGQRPYKCTYCEKAFSQSNDLTLHIRRHTGDKPYVCEICGDRFIQGTALQNHRRSHGHFPPGGAPHPHAPLHQVKPLQGTLTAVIASKVDIIKL